MFKSSRSFSQQMFKKSRLKKNCSLFIRSLSWQKWFFICRKFNCSWTDELFAKFWTVNAQPLVKMERKIWHNFDCTHLLVQQSKTRKLLRACPKFFDRLPVCAFALISKIFDLLCFSFEQNEQMIASVCSVCVCFTTPALNPLRVLQGNLSGASTASFEYISPVLSTINQSK